MTGVKDEKYVGTNLGSCMSADVCSTGGKNEVVESTSHIVPDICADSAEKLKAHSEGLENSLKNMDENSPEFHEVLRELEKIKTILSDGGWA
ncbi:hypothetical protein DET50_107142 [Marinobacter pelagius]|uniref:Uncharacterized protein n=1 Tax=Marinobacter pelagius TaxID=379482 RepID=A0A366GV56_9GAMM|nr:hypothetical protein [Marinobacter pelagius]RBP30727.1 hypothetical protein DET50_107142 [Marinobacter pelagius]